METWPNLSFTARPPGLLSDFTDAQASKAIKAKTGTAVPSRIQPRLFILVFQLSLSWSSWSGAVLRRMRVISASLW